MSEGDLSHCSTSFPPHDMLPLGGVLFTSLPLVNCRWFVSVGPGHWFVPVVGVQSLILDQVQKKAGSVLDYFPIARLKFVT